MFPLQKGGDPSDLHNYRPISKLSILAKILEASQLKEYLAEHNILTHVQSGFRAGHSTVTVTLLLLNDIINALDKKQHCADLFVDLSKAFDSVDHEHLLNRLSNIGIGNTAINWLKKYLTE